MRSVFITGYWRSGTSLLLRLFDGHPQVSVMPVETGIITILEKDPAFLDKLKKCKNKYQLLCVIAQNPITRFQDLINASLDGMSFSRTEIYYPFEFNLDTFATTFFNCVNSENSLKGIVHGYYYSIRNAWINHHGNNSASIYAVQRAHRIDRYPGEDSVRFVMDNVRDMAVVELVRDPVYQISSALKGEKSLSLEDAIVGWGYAYNYIKNREKKYSGQYKLVKYEDLVSNTETSMRGCADLMGIDYDEILSNPSFNGEIWKGNSSFGELAKLELRKETFLSDIQLNHIQKSLGDYRNELGYPELSAIY